MKINHCFVAVLLYFSLTERGCTAYPGGYQPPKLSSAALFDYQWDTEPIMPGPRAPPPPE